VDAIANRYPRSPVGGEGDLERRVVDRHGTGDLIGVAVGVVVESLDHRVVEGVATDVRLRVRRALERGDEVVGRDRDVLERRGIGDARLERERPRQLVLGDLRFGRSQVRVDLRPSLFGRHALVRHQRAQQAAPVVLPGDRVVLLLRIERRYHVGELRHLQRATRQVARGRLTGRGVVTGTTVVTATCGGNETEYRDERDHPQHPLQLDPLSCISMPS
jgi:hypothetical protein